MQLLNMVGLQSAMVESFDLEKDRQKDARMKLCNSDRCNKIEIYEYFIVES